MLSFWIQLLALLAIAGVVVGSTDDYNNFEFFSKFISVPEAVKSIQATKPFVRNAVTDVTEYKGFFVDNTMDRTDGNYDCTSQSKLFSQLN